MAAGLTFAAFNILVSLAGFGTLGVISGEIYMLSFSTISENC